MEREGRFSWGMMGKADYAQAGAIVDSLPEAIRRQLKNDMRELLQNVVFLGWKQSEKSGRGVAYCWPSELWFAKKLNKSVRTIQRCLVRLKQAGLLVWRRRANRDGSWTSNLYQLGKTFLASLFARQSKKVKQFRHTTSLSHNDLKKGIEVANTNGDTSTSSYSIKSISEAVAKSALRGALLLRETSEKEAQEIASRKEALRKQAEALKARGM